MNGCGYRIADAGINSLKARDLIKVSGQA